MKPVRWLTAILAAGMIVLAPSSRAQSLQEYCHSLWDLALVARSVAMAPGISDETHREILARIYAPEDDKAAATIERLRASARSAQGGAAIDFANGVRARCILFRGNLDAVLGVRL